MIEFVAGVVAGLLIAFGWMRAAGRRERADRESIQRRYLFDRR